MSTPPLRLLRLAEAPGDPADLVVRPTVGWTWMMFPFLALAAGVAHGYREGRMGPVSALFFGGVFTFAGWMIFSAWRAGRRRDAWVMRVGRDRVLLRFRSWLNRGPDIAQVVEVPIAAIASVRQTRRGMWFPGGRRAETRRYTYLDFRVQPGVELGPLREALGLERTLRRDRVHWNHVPVNVRGDDVIRVEMAVGGSSLRPGADEVLRVLATRIAVEPPEEESLALVGMGQVPREEQEATIVALVETGETDRAVRLAQFIYAEDASHARQRVQRLSGGPGIQRPEIPALPPSEPA